MVSNFEWSRQENCNNHSINLKNTFQTVLLTQAFNNFSYTLQNKHNGSRVSLSTPTPHQKKMKLLRPRLTKRKRVDKEEEVIGENKIVLTRFGAVFHFYLSEDWPKKLDVLSRVFFPVAFLIFNLVYWILHVGAQDWESAFETKGYFMIRYHQVAIASQLQNIYKDFVINRFLVTIQGNEFIGFPLDFSLSIFMHGSKAHYLYHHCHLPLELIY